MPYLKPFRGIFYNPQKVDIAAVVAPPYDVISPSQQNELYEASPYNVVRLILGREEDRYSSAASHFEAWKKEGILIRDERPAAYLLSQRFSTPDGRIHERGGFIMRCKLEDFGTGSILPHEKTLAKPKEDRFRLLMATKAMFSQIFGLYADPQRVVDRYVQRHMDAAPAIEIMFEGVRNRLWKLKDPAAITVIQEFMRDRQILVADGHHRYETALVYRDAMRLKNPNHTGEEPYNFVMMFLTNVHDPGLVVLPTHRLLHSLPQFNVARFLESLTEFFHLDVQADERELLTNLASRQRGAFGLVVPSVPRFILCWLKASADPFRGLDESVPSVLKELDVTLLHSVIFGKLLGISAEAQEHKRNLDYVKDAEEAVRAVWKGRADAALLMNPTPVDRVRAVAEAGYTMPQKSTYFYPKLLSGLVMNSLEED